jgi:hypothetical protein
MEQKEVKTVVDRVVFRMPLDHECQFPAMAVLQHFVNGYEQRCKLSDVSRGKLRYKLAYDVVMPRCDWEFFLHCGFKMPCIMPEPVPVLEYDMLVDMSDEVIDQFRHSGKHVAQVCIIMAGVGACSPFPDIRQVRPRSSKPVWLRQKEMEALLEVRDNEVTGVVSEANRYTYLAASMGLAVVEIVPKGRPRTWLSKWGNPLYRAIDIDDAALIESAISSIEKGIVNVIRQQPSAVPAESGR